MLRGPPCSRLAGVTPLALMATTAYRNVLCDVDAPLATVTMNRPQRRNALSLEHMEELLDCIAALGARADVSAVILTGNGPVFCSGHDLSEMVDRDDADYERLFAVCTELMTAIQTIPQPVIARVHGMATAAGCQLVATCDLAIASEAASFATPGVRIGLFCSTPMVALSRNVGRKKALEMLLTGEALDAHEACAAGLVNRVVPASELEAQTQALAERIAEASPNVVGIGKQAFYRQVEVPQADAYELTRRVMAANAAGPDAHEGITAFLEKRPPRWPNTA
jgi:enoyl-CoA hydratase/carnithine racemase